MARNLVLAATALCGGILLAPPAGTAQTAIDALGVTVTTTPAVTTDYLFRGLSQTRGKPAVQLTVDAEHSSGLYVGAFVSNVAFQGTNARQEVDYSAGYRFTLGDLKLDIGGTYYTYAGYTAPRGGFELNFAELALRTSYEIAPVKFVGLAAWSPNFYGESGSGFYLEGGFDMALDYGFTISPRIGYQWIERNLVPATGSRDGYFGSPDYLTLSVGISREIVGGVIGTFTGVWNSNTGRQDCFGGQKVCDSRAVLTLSRPF
ncbi:TorF family putative porin [Falsiroseomonas ponticola]|uniref:TorF family putative porin n=1 Tax=Falsiroseomonas ponticola TaxID=2786951 RepID=UPI001932E1EC|nr:TorF family putative porin [Roseomonas ponticola]